MYKELMKHRNFVMTLQPRMLENLDESSDEDEFFGDESIDQKMGSGLAAETIIL